MNASATQPKYRILCDELRKRLVKMEPGSGFMSVRDIMHGFGVSQATVTKALDYLCEEGLLEKNVGSGTFVTEEVLRHRKGSPPSLCLVIPRWESMYFLTVANAFTSSCERRGCSYEIVIHDWRQQVPPKLHLRKVDGMLLVPSKTALDYDEFKKLEAFGKPFIIFGRALKGVDLDCVFPDEVYCGNLAASHLIKLGHKKLAVIVSEPGNQVVLDRVSGFVEHAELAGLKAEVIECGIVHGDLAPEKVYSRIKGILAKGPFEPTGVFMISASSALGALKAFHEGGVRVPQDVSLIACTGDALSPFYHPALTVINEPFEEMVEACIDMLMERLAKPGLSGLPARRFRPALIERESTAEALKLETPEMR